MARAVRDESIGLDEFEDAMDAGALEVDDGAGVMPVAVKRDGTETTHAATKANEKNVSAHTKSPFLRRTRSKSEIDELKAAFDRADKAKSGEIDRESLREVLSSDETRAVRKAKSGKFNADELEALARAVDVDNSGTTSFNELVQVLGAAEKIAGSPSKHEEEDEDNDAHPYEKSTTEANTRELGENVAATVTPSKTSENVDSKVAATLPKDLKTTDETSDDWEQAEKQYTSAALVRHRRNSAARRSLAANNKDAAKVGSDCESSVDKITKHRRVEDEEKKGERVPSIRVEQSECACACVVM